MTSDQLRPSGPAAVADLAEHRARNGSIERADVAQLTDAFHAHRSSLHGFARRRLMGDSALAEEAVQETFLRAWRSRHVFDPARGSLRMWLFAICRTATADAARLRERHRRDGDRPVIECGSFDSVVDFLDARSQVAQALRQLPPSQVDAILQVHVRERSCGDAAAELGVPVGTVKSRVHLGLKAARQALSPVA